VRPTGPVTDAADHAVSALPAEPFRRYSPFVVRPKKRKQDKEEEEEEEEEKGGLMGRLR
jgi:hypothetical protein